VITYLPIRVTALIGGESRFALPVGRSADMTLDPTPLSRLLRLENAIEKLIAAIFPQGLHQHLVVEAKSTSIWPADELLLTRLLRRTPEVLNAYQSPAELTDANGQGLHLTLAESSSHFHCCELIDGDAVVWLDAKAPDWAWKSHIFRHLFDTPADLDDSLPLVLQSLSLFKPISRGVSWTLQRRGEMVVQARQFPEQAERAGLLRRIENLERDFLQQRIKQNEHLNELQVKLRVQHEMIERLRRLLPIPKTLSD
jgi:hypothetical protein